MPGNAQAVPAMRRLARCCLALICVLGALTTQAQETTTCTAPLAIVTSVQGQVSFRSDDTRPWRPAQLNQALCGGEQLRTEALSRAQVRLNQHLQDAARDGTLLQLNERSSLVLPQAADPWWLNLIQGAMHILSRTPKHLTIRTLFCNANVEGTEFLVKATPRQTDVEVYEGKVVVINDLGSVRLTQGEAAITEPHRAPRREILIKPRDAVQWALYYPPIIDTRVVPAGPHASLFRRVYESYRRGQIAEAIQTLDKLPDTAQDAYYHELRAALYLAVGQVDYARQAIISAITLNANDANALSLESIIALVQNNKDKARQYAEQAVAADPNSPTPYVARSYAEQASFKLDAAARTPVRPLPSPLTMPSPGPASPSSNLPVGISAKRTGQPTKREASNPDWQERRRSVAMRR